MICQQDAPTRLDPSRPSTTPCQWHLPESQVQQSRDQVLLRGLYTTELGHVPDARARIVDGGTDDRHHTLLFCRRGKVRVETGDRAFDLYPEEAAILPAGTPFRIQAPGTHTAEVHWLQFAGEDSNYYVRTLGQGLSKFVLSATSTTRVTDVFRQLETVLEEEATEWQLIHAAHLARLLISHLLGQDATHYESCEEPLHPGVATAVRYMQRNLDLTLALKDVARQAGLSVSHFCALFRSQMGVTPMEYLTKLKIQKARRLLVSTALTVQEVAQQVGYEDRYYFSRLFRKINGVPPVTYRRQQRDQARAVAC